MKGQSPPPGWLLITYAVIFIGMAFALCHQETSETKCHVGDKP